MSKAFTRESDLEAAEDSIPRRSLASRSGGVLTPAGANRFRAELERLMAEKQSSEAGGGDTTVVRSRIRQLQELLDSSTVAELPLDRGSVAFGAKVEVRYRNGEIVQYEIVGPEEIDLEQDRISAQSPLGRQLIGRRAGERFQFQAPAGETELEILRIVYEAAEANSAKG